MTKNDQALLDAVKQMEEEAPSVGLCGFAFKVLREEIEKIIAERDALATAQEWISVKDLLPPPETDVMVAFDDGEVWCLWQNWRGSDEENPLLYYVDYPDKTHEVTHWKPMPKPPESVT